MSSNSDIETAALKATITGLNREIRDMKIAHRDSNKQSTDSIEALANEIAALRLVIQPVLKSSARLEQLLIEADRQDGMKSLAKLIVSGGLIAMLAAAIVGIYEFFSKGLGS